MKFRIPGSTYRLQLRPGFGFAEVLAQLDYLQALGITDLYLSPVLAADPGSQHGYDVVDPERINPELGGREGLSALAEELQRRDMGLLLDTVPNHMCVTSNENRYWMDVLENGPSSPYARFFDIDWDPPKPDLVGKVLLPILGDQYGAVLENQELNVHFGLGGFELRYYAAVLPLAPRSWIRILESVLVDLQAREPLDPSGVILIESILTAIRHLPTRDETDPERLRERNREKEVIKMRLAALVEESAGVKGAIQTTLHRINGQRGQPHSFDELDALLDEQAFRLAFWRVATDEINYRRFFDINELAAIRVEDPTVFESTHAMVLGLLRDGIVTGLRVDHVDGLFDPVGYLEMLRRAANSATVSHDPTVPGPDQPSVSVVTGPYVVVEKILADGERLPDEWPIHGTTGYDFLDLVGGVFVPIDGVNGVKAVYERFTNQHDDFEQIAYECKLLILQHSMASQVAMLARRLDRISEQHRHSRDFTFQSLQEALVEVLARFPVYRTYVRPDGSVSDTDRQWINRAVAAATAATPAMSDSVFAFLRAVLVGEHPAGLSDTQLRFRQDFALRLQQVTGAIMAKAVEDTAFYRYFPLASRTEVGGTPERPGTTLRAFHDGNQERREAFPHSLLATTTHDTKRSEDVRARIHVIAEDPQGWDLALDRWRAHNAPVKTVVDGRIAPDCNEEYLIFQTLVGVWPLGELDEGLRHDLVQRVQAYLVKAQREAKIHTSWVSPNLAWERAGAEFISRIVAPTPDNGFLQEFLRFLAPLARAGMYGSLSQLVLKMTCPGVPDIYQGNELWDLSLVDPDNRRPVDFELRARRLAELDAEASRDLPGLLRRLVASPDDGRLKLFVTSRGLRFRNRNRRLFDEGRYVPVLAQGAQAERVVSLARTRAEQAVLVVVGRFLGASAGSPGAPTAWGDTALPIASLLPPGRFREVFSEIEFQLEPSRLLPVAQVFNVLPVAILERIS